MSGAPGFAGIRRLAEEFRERSGLSPGASVPIDAVTRSASGMDPHSGPDKRRATNSARTTHAA
jgi:K+-transporting ATPase c subunit